MLCSLVADYIVPELDPATAFGKLRLTEKNTVVTRVDKEQTKSLNHFTFRNIAQVMCAPLKSSVKDRYYWEVAWKGEEGVKIAVAYDQIQRYGLLNECRFGRNALSWCLECTNGGFSFWHKNEKKDIHGDMSSRIGVFLDYEAGTISFFNRFNEKLVLLHKVETELNDLRPGFWLGLGSTVGICRKDRATKKSRHTDYQDYDDDQDYYEDQDYYDQWD